MYGHWGFRAMGLTGSATPLPSQRVTMAAVLLAGGWRGEERVGRRKRPPHGPLRRPLFPDLPRLRRMAALGLPAALQILAEGAVFGVVTVFAARLDEASLAAHGIALIVISTTYMAPLDRRARRSGWGQATGRNDPRGVAASGGPH